MSPDALTGSLFDGGYAGRRVLVTGDSGFLGGWTTRWLVALGAQVAGYSRRGGAAPISYRGDITDQPGIETALTDFAPELIVHLAASATVAAGFRSPLDTFATNVMGTAAVLHGALRQPATRAVVVVGTPATVELDDLLAVNPYPASKLAVEAVVGAYAHPRTQSSAGRAEPLGIGVARPGVMLGGDWGEGRLLADVVRDVRAGRPVVLRAPAAVRPWQHVLDGVGGALLLGSRLLVGVAPRRRYDFGRPDAGTAEPVVEVVTRFLAALGVADWPVQIEGSGGDRIELGATAAVDELGWTPVWDLAQTLNASARWYQADDDAVGAAMDATVRAYAEAATVAWGHDLVHS